MKKIYYILSALFLCVVATSAQEAGKTVVIKTNVGTMKAILYDDVPNHTRTFIERAKRGDFNGTLFTRVLPEFMIQGGPRIPRTLPPVLNAALAILPPRYRPRSTRNISIRKEPWPLPANRTISTRKRNRICRNSLSCRGRSIGKPNWIR